MRNRFVVVFLAEILCGVLLMGGGAVVLERMGQEAQAQEENTWQAVTEGLNPGGAYDLQSWGGGHGTDRSLDKWIASMPEECDIQTVGADLNVFVYYRCPAS